MESQAKDLAISASSDEYKGETIYKEAGGDLWAWPIRLNSIISKKTIKAMFKTLKESISLPYVLPINEFIVAIEQKLNFKHDESERTIHYYIVFPHIITDDEELTIDMNSAWISKVKIRK